MINNTNFTRHLNNPNRTYRNNSLVFKTSGRNMGSRIQSHLEDETPVGITAKRSRIGTNPFNNNQGLPPARGTSNLQWRMIEGMFTPGGGRIEVNIGSPDKPIIGLVSPFGTAIIACENFTEKFGIDFSQERIYWPQSELLDSYKDMLMYMGKLLWALREISLSSASELESDSEAYKGDEMDMHNIFRDLTKAFAKVRGGENNGNQHNPYLEEAFWRMIEIILGKEALQKHRGRAATEEQIIQEKKESRIQIDKFVDRRELLVIKNEMYLLKNVALAYDEKCIYS